MSIKRTLIIDNREITKPSSSRFRQLLRAFKNNVTNSKSEDELTDFIDALANDNEKMMDYIVNTNRNFNRIEVVETYDK